MRVATYVQKAAAVALLFSICMSAMRVSRIVTDEKAAMDAHAVALANTLVPCPVATCRLPGFAEKVQQQTPACGHQPFPMN